jgi:S-(hydroxymethyl)glutathione dehydrogenase / alcohol dehydrogenase
MSQDILWGCVLHKKNLKKFDLLLPGHGFKMKAAVLHALNVPLRTRNDIEIPMLRHGQVLVKLAYSGVCHSQLMEARGGRGEDAYLPHLLGHEGSGVVVETGPDVTKVQSGDRIVLGWIKGSGIEAGGVKYKCSDGILNGGSVTTFNDYAIVSENRCVKVPIGVPMDIAALFGCAVLTGAGIITNSVRPIKGSSIAIFGLGGIGLSALMGLVLFDCEMVIAVDISEDRLQMAKEFGATHTINAAEYEPVEAIRGLTHGRGTDYTVEAAGRSDTIEKAFDAVRRGGGLCVFASHPSHGSRISLDPFELICGKHIKGSWGGGSDPDRDIPIYADLYLKDKLPLDKLITKRYSLEEVNQALDDLEQNKVVRPLIVFDTALEENT